MSALGGKRTLVKAATWANLRPDRLELGWAMRWILIGLAMAAIDGPTLAAAPPDSEVCYSATATDDEKIAGCTSLIAGANIGSEKRGLAFINRSEAELTKGLLDQAVSDATQAISLIPNSPQAYESRGAAYFRKSRFGPPISGAATGGVHLVPIRPPSHRPEYDQAIADFSQAISLDPDRANFFVERGNTYSAEGEYDKAITDLTRALAIDPTSIEALEGRADDNRHRGLYDRAIADDTTVIALKQANLFLSLRAYETRASDYMHNGYYQGAITDYSRVIARQPGFVGPYLERARAYHLAGKDALALPDAQHSVAINPTMSLVIRGEIYEGLGQRDLAIADYRASIKLGAYQEVATEGLRRLGVSQ